MKVITYIANIRYKDNTSEELPLRVKAIWIENYGIESAITMALLKGYEHKQYEFEEAIDITYYKQDKNKGYRATDKQPLPSKGVIRDIRFS